MDSVSLNINNKLFHKFEIFCEEHGTTADDEIESFIRSILDDDVEITEEYQRKLDTIRKGKFIRVNNFAEFFGL
ncbi:MAG: hypothetical protein AMQ74_00318 [Candidatus Methanofastidiosum methylothiophilum]|uniref:Uncharacterized protein n=1 Tax=Candidatus Methanofastidiosum methylothiophilum TaxID=1705564 RepID=A0A150J8Z4_9EURY|nr:MAG: hypothetical protein AMQ74_00318 [Candidatus Methanofastidiosum methylthiophilus]NMC76326.1 hypothetical protein [Candidatus Methanofastidiosa archaeon]